MTTWLLVVLATGAALITQPVLAVSLPHPGGPIFSACAEDMPEDPAIVAERLRAAGLTERPVSELPTRLHRDHQLLLSWETELMNEEPSVENLARSETYIRESLNGRSLLEELAEFDPASFRAFASEDETVSVVLELQYGEWFCWIVLDDAPEDIATFYETARPDDALFSNPLKTLYFQHGSGDESILYEMFPSLFPGFYSASYSLADEALISSLRSKPFQTGFAAIIGAYHEY